MTRVWTSFEFKIKGKPLDHLVGELAGANASRDQAKAHLGQVKEVMEAAFAVELAQAADDLAQAEAMVEGLREDVQRTALAQFKRNPSNKRPHKAVGIRMNVTYDYDAEEALTYAREHIPTAVELDAGAFKKAAKVLDLDFVEIGEKPSATISKDLSQYLEKEEKTE